MNMICIELTSKVIRTTFFKHSTMINESTKMKPITLHEIKINSHFVSKEH